MSNERAVCFVYGRQLFLDKLCVLKNSGEEGEDCKPRPQFCIFGKRPLEKMFENSVYILLFYIPLLNLPIHTHPNTE